MNNYRIFYVGLSGEEFTYEVDCDSADEAYLLHDLGFPGTTITRIVLSRKGK